MRTRLPKRGGRCDMAWSVDRQLQAMLCCMVGMMAPWPAAIAYRRVYIRAL